MSSKIPVNREQAYGVRVNLALNTLQEAFGEAALKREATLCQSMQDKLDCAYMALKELFPEIPKMDPYGSSMDLVRDISNVVSVIFTAEDSVMRSHWHALIRARLSSGKVANRIRDLASDPALTSISTRDPFPLSLVLGEDQAYRAIQVGANQTLILGQKPELPPDILDAARNSSLMQEYMFNRDEVMKDLQHMYRVFGAAYKRAPWSADTHKGAIFAWAFNGTKTAVAVEAFAYEALINQAGRNSVYSALKGVVGGGLVALADADGYNYTSQSQDKVSVCSVSELRGDGIVSSDTIVHEFQLYDEAAEPTGVVYARNTGAADTVDFSVSYGGVNNIVALVATGASASYVLAGIGTLDVAVFNTGIANEVGLAWRIRGLVNTGRAAVTFSWTTVPAAGVRKSIIATSSSPIFAGDVEDLNDAQVLRMLIDNGASNLMTRFLRLREELNKEGAEEEWYLQAYHSYIIGATPAYTDGNELTPAEVTSIKSRMLNPVSWSDFSNLRGFIRKIFDDIGSLMALAQSQDPA
jgi:hypothetical protein